MVELEVCEVCVRAGGAKLVDGASLRLAQGELVALLGPNGAGKTSLLRAAVGLTVPSSGSVTLGGAPIHALTATERALKVSYLPQVRPLAWPIRVRDVVALGRFAQGARVGRLVPADQAAIEAAMVACGLGALADRRTDSLSGGELARVHCARAFAAQTPLLVADEPVGALDPRHQFQVMSLIRDFVDAGGGGLVVLHDIALAARYADRLVWMKSGRIVADGPTIETLTDERLAAVFGIRARVEGRTVHLDGVIQSKD